MATRIYHMLCVTTSASVTSYGANTGIWLEELAAPYYCWQEAGYQVEICSLNGGSPPIDPGSMQNDSIDDFSKRFLVDEDAQKKFHNSRSLTDVIKSGDLSKYSCLYLVGGHGCIEDFPENMDIKEAVEHFYDEVGGCLSAICHGPLGLVSCKYNGQPLLKGKFVAAFSNEEETLLGLHTVVRMSVEDCMDGAGAVCAPRAPWRPNAVVDGRLVTGQNPQSSLEVAQRVLDVLRSLGDKFNSPLNVNKPWGK